MQFFSNASIAYLSYAVVTITWLLMVVLRNMSKHVPSERMTSMKIMSG